MTTPLNGKKIYGPGRFFGIGNYTAPTPMRPYLVQDQSVTFKREVKEIYGENQLAADGSSGTMSVSGKVSLGTTNARLVVDQLFSDAGTAGSQINEADNELGTITSHIITVVNSAAWATDLGVLNTTTGARYVCVTSGPVAGVSYSVAAGVYTFATGETGTTFKISYLYTVAVGGELITLTNQKQGKVGVFTSIMVFPWQNQAAAVEQDVLTLNVCLLTDHEVSTKMSDYGKPTFSFSSFCDANDNLGTFSFAEAS